MNSALYEVSKFQSFKVSKAKIDCMRVNFETLKP
jgi:hypothetical protein